MSQKRACSTEETHQRGANASESETNPLVSFVVATYNRPDDLAEAIDSILNQRYRPIEVIVVSNSTDTDHEHELELFERGGRFEEPFVQYYHYPERMGVSRAKNCALEKASGDVIIQLDDDAVIADAIATKRILEKFRKHEDIGIQAFQSRNYYTGEIKTDEIPDSPKFDMTPGDEYRTTSFIGLGVAFRREALEIAGLYPDGFVYGFEEMDLSLRVLDSGYDILYTPSVVIRHKKSPEGRILSLETKERLVENRINIALRNLPWRYVFFTTIIYSIYGLLLTRRLSSLGRMYRRLYENRHTILDNRNVIHNETIAHIKSRNMMLFCWWYGPHPRRILGPDGDVGRLFWETQTP